MYHPNRNGTFIRIYNKANPLIPAWEADCGYSPDCIYSGQTVLFRVQNPSWIPGAHYYVLFDSGAASGNVFCAPESAAITGDLSFFSRLFSRFSSIRSQVLELQYLESSALEHDNNEHHAADDGDGDHPGKHLHRH